MVFFAALCLLSAACKPNNSGLKQSLPNGTCASDAQCDDGDPCNGSERCGADSHCASGTRMVDGTVCETDSDKSTSQICLATHCTLSTCGDGYRDPNALEVCDDGNAVDGDGCDTNCTFPCTTAEQCDDLVTCNGQETCDTSKGYCVADLPVAMATACDADSNGATRDICLAFSCVASACGDALVDQGAGETCDDGNTTSGDGCSADCKSSEVCGNGVVDASKNESCDDGNTVGGDGCSPDCKSTEVCGNGVVDISKGEVCDDANATGGDGCSSNCKSNETCGNGIVDSLKGEICDDGNLVNGDGCESTCTRGCSDNTQCNDGDSCNGTETCNLTTFSCVAGTPVADGTLCDADSNTSTRDVCLASHCAASVCGDGYLDTVKGEACDDGNTANGDACTSQCQLPPTAYRITELRLVDPHIWITVPLFGNCADITDNGVFGQPSANQQLGASLTDSPPADGYFDFNMLSVFRPVNPLLATTPVDLVIGACTAAATSIQSQCNVGANGTLQSNTSNNKTSGVCYQADPTTLTTSPNYPDPNIVSAPCFVTGSATTTVNAGGLLLNLTASRLSGVYSPSDNPISIINGVLSGFISETSAKTTTFPASVPILGGQPLYKALADAKRTGSSCASHSDRDVGKGPNGEDGYWFYINVTAQKVTWSD